jgi:hypothetical protein
MSYFFAEVNHSRTKTDHIDRLFSDFTQTSAKRVVQSDLSSVVNYVQDKVIRDVFVRHNKSNSWLMLIGTPLLEYDTDDELQTLIEKFLKDYKRTLKEEIDGHFALFAYDASQQIFIAATDYNNLIPIFYAVENRALFFSSSELVLAKLLQSDIDPLGFSQGIHLGVTWDSITRFKDIKKMNPCEIVTVDKQHTLSKERYWKPADEKVWRDNFDLVLERWGATLRDSVLAFYNKASVKDTVWTDFTGGEDARLLVAQCHALRLPYKARVGSFGGKDIAVATRAAEQARIDLVVDPYCQISHDQVVTYAKDICLDTDGYGSFFYGSTRFATNAVHRPLVFDYLHFSGVPGGEAFRGTYYSRAKLLRPAKSDTFDYRFFTRLKYLLDYVPNLTIHNDTDFTEAVYSTARKALSSVDQFPAGLQVDHLLREFQTCLRGLSMKRPSYLPLATKHMTTSIYQLSPRFKKGGYLTKACTEALFPALAFTKTVNHIPTVRRSITRFHLFLPEYYSTVRKVANGFTRRFMRLRQSSKTLSGHHRLDIHRPTMMAILNHPPFSNWLRSSSSMLTGSLYNKPFIDKVLCDARQGKCSHVEVLGRIINQELACRYIYDA